MTMTGTNQTRTCNGKDPADRRCTVPSAEAVILAEYQHRVANDLHVALAALRLAGRQVVGLAASSIEEAAERIGELVRLQRLLAPPTRTVDVDLAEQVKAVCDGLADVRFAGSYTAIMPFVDPIQVDARIAWVVSVIVAELVTNAGKHALPLGGGRIVVEVDGPVDALRLRVTDDGRGAIGPVLAAAAPGWKPGQGSAVLKAILDSVGADMSVSTSGEGTMVEVNFGRIVPARCTRREGLSA